MNSDTAIVRRHTLRMETAIVTLKCLCYVLIGVFTPWAAALGQWVNSGEWPPRIVWVAIILPASAIGGATQLLSFLSGSYRDFLDKKQQQEKGQ